MSRKLLRHPEAKAGIPFEAEGAQRLNRRRRRLAAGRLRRAGITADPLTAFLRSRRGALWLVVGVLLLALALYGVYVLRA